MSLHTARKGGNTEDFFCSCPGNRWKTAVDGEVENEDISGPGCRHSETFRRIDLSSIFCP